MGEAKTTSELADARAALVASAIKSGAQVIAAAILSVSTADPNRFKDMLTFVGYVTRHKENTDG